MTTQEAIETLGRLKHYIQTDVNRYGGGWDSIVEAIDTVVKELEKPLPTDVQKEAWNAASEEVEALMQKACWDLTLCEDIKKLKK